jgi:acyl-CoA thioester hydrolase
MSAPRRCERGKRVDQEKPRPRKLVHVYRIQVRFADFDVNRHVNNVAYFTYMEQARVDWLKTTGMQTTPKGEGPVVVQASCNYRKAMSFVDTVDVRMYVGPAGRTSFPTYYDIVSTDDENCTYADGQAIMVWTDRTSGVSRPVPDELRTLLA